MLSYKEFKETALNEAKAPVKEVPLKLVKKSKDWYRITLEMDKWDIDTSVVDIYRTKFGEWSVCEGEPDLGLKVQDKNRYVFIKFGSAKLFAMDLAKAIKDEKPYPLFSADKYDL
jgi:hypothetical protein